MRKGRCVNKCKGRGEMPEKDKNGRMIENKQTTWRRRCEKRSR
jgi:hypothetical protein